MDLKLNLKLVFSLRVNRSHLAFWIFLDLGLLLSVSNLTWLKNFEVEYLENGTR